jgi:putative membrane protein
VRHWRVTIIGLLYVQALACHAAYAALVLEPAGAASRWAAVAREWGPPLFARGQILASFVVIVLLLRARFAWRWLGTCVVILVLGFVVECAGLRYGVPFGDYEFTDLLGPRLPGGVPMLIPLSWFSIAISAGAVASFVFPGRGPAATIVGAVLMVVWDLGLDPVMSHLYRFWVFQTAGTYYGIPLSNFGGWFLVGLAAMAILRASSWARFDWQEDRPLLGHYGACVLTPLGLALLSGLWLAAAATAAAVAIGAVLLWRERRRVSADGAPLSMLCPTEPCEKI